MMTQRTLEIPERGPPSLHRPGVTSIFRSLASRINQTVADTIRWLFFFFLNFLPNVPIVTLLFTCANVLPQITELHDCVPGLPVWAIVCSDCPFKRFGAQIGYTGDCVLGLPFWVIARTECSDNLFDGSQHALRMCAERFQHILRSLSEYM